ncbi:MAG: HlyD family efflux transporter periplasmic adaptor subunit [Actinobacteria bacterium]|nr:HlyD family efflux transporter periplasmic adaptor subunit [Actinomycetota bacterium]
MRSRPRFQIPRPRRPERLHLPRRPLEWGLAIVALALVVIAGATLGGGSSTSSAASKRTATVGKGVVQSTVSGNGTLEPAQKVELSFGASGEVTAIDAKAGEKVKKGQVLARVDSSSARAGLASAEAALIEAEESVEAAAEAEEEESEEVAYEGGAHSVLVDLTTTEGAATPTEAPATETEGTTGEEPAVEGESSAREEVKKAKEEAKKAREEAKRAREEAKRAAAATPKEEETTSGEAGGAAVGGSSSQSSSTGEASESAAAGGGATVSLPTAEANLREAELTVKSARQEVRETTLRAPISGTIASVSGSVGETVSGGSSSGGGTSESSSLGATGGESTGSGSGSAFIVLAQLHRLKMEVSFSEADIGKVREGQTATVSIDSMEGTELAGEVTKVSVLPSESSGVVEYPATILLTQSAKGVRAGMSASAEVVVEQVKNAVTVSSEALSGSSVTVEEDGKEVTKSVKTGLEGDETTEIVSGLKVGETVILPEATVATTTTGGESSEGAATLGGFPSAGGFSGGPPSGGFPGGGP